MGWSRPNGPVGRVIAVTVVAVALAGCGPTGLWGWGDASSGQLGLGSTSGPQSNPAQVGGVTWRSASVPASAATVTITARVPSTVLVLGRGTYLTGRVTPASATPRVVVQVRVGGRWGDRQASAVGAGGVYRVDIKPTRLGRYDMRVRSAGGSVVSNVVALRVVLATGASPGAAIASYAASRNVGYAGACAAAGSDDDGMWCTSLYADRGTSRIYIVGYTFSEYTGWLLVSRMGSGWAVSDARSFNDFPGRPPW